MSTAKIEIEVGCTPKAQPRIKARVVQPRNGRAFAHIYTPSSADDFKNEVILQTMAHADFPREPWLGPVRLDVQVYFDRPKYMRNRKYFEGPILHDVKPDRDNVDKAVLDALTEAGLFKDDSQVCLGEISKWYVALGCQPGVVIVAERMMIAGCK